MLFYFALDTSNCPLYRWQSISIDYLLKIPSRHDNNVTSIMSFIPGDVSYVPNFGGLFDDIFFFSFHSITVILLNWCRCLGWLFSRHSVHA